MGYGDTGALGLGDRRSINTPTRVRALESVVICEAAGGASHSLAADEVCCDVLNQWECRRCICCLLGLALICFVSLCRMGTFMVGASAAAMTQASGFSK